MQRIGEIEVEVHLVLDIIARVKFGRCIGTEGGVHRVFDKEIGLMSAVRTAQIPP